MNNKVSHSILAIVSLIGITISIHTKYFQNHFGGLGMVDNSVNVQVTPKQLNLSESIDFLEKQERLLESNNLTIDKGISNEKTLLRFKRINAVCIGGMLLFSVLFLTALYKIRQYKL